MASARPLRLVLIGIVVLGGLWLWMGYNGLITARGQVQGAWANVQTQYQRRADLVPNLVATVKGSAAFEESTFTAITQARSQWQQATTRPEQIAAAGNFDSALSRLLVTVEAYPQLQSTAAFRDLMTQLEGTENRITVARKDYNDAAASYNIQIARFPTNILAGIFGFDGEQLFQAQAGSENAPTVDFGS